MKQPCDIGRAVFGTGAPGDGWQGQFASPVRVEQAASHSQVAEVVRVSEREARAGRWVVLLLAYEAAPAFDAALTVHAPADGLPLAWMGAYDAPLTGAGVGERAGMPAPAPSGPSWWLPALAASRFAAELDRILGLIAAGDTYQVNYTFPMTARLHADAWQWFHARARQADVPFAAYVDLGRFVVMSLSPELFLRRAGRQVTTRPMKGTSRRGRWPAEDEALASALAANDKARAENVMIVDLLRNDLGRVAETGSVRVRDLWRLERYPTVWQLTSTVDATLRPDVDLLGLLGATFPCGSVTGAPKVRTMEIIASIEQGPRGLYTGALCLLRPGGDFVSSVSIRTAVLDRQTGVTTFSVGAGITADSVPADEWNECLAKARVVRPPAVPREVGLFETLRLEEGVLARRDAHVGRICASARLFGWHVDRSALDAELVQVAAAHPAGVWRVRLVLASDGTSRIEAVPFAPTTQRWRVALARTPVDARDPLLFNKTTRRDVYDAARAAVPGVDDVLLYNARGEITESTVASLVLDLDGVRVTPPIVCGLLPGILRGELVARGQVRERVVRLPDLRRAAHVWLVNALRGWIEVDLVQLNAGGGTGAGLGRRRRLTPRTTKY